MIILIAIVSILAITGAIYLANHAFGFRVCPICAGVSLTWAWMLVGMLADILPTSDFQLLTSILMGGSVVGMAYQAEKLRPLRDASAGKLLLWKTLFIPAGFSLVYAALSAAWFVAGGALLALGLIAFVFLFRSSRRKQTAPHPQTPDQRSVEDLEEKMKKCC